MDKETVLKDLRGQFGKKSVLYADEIAELLGKSEQALANIKHRGGLPFPVKKIGGRLAVSLYDVADWLASEPSETASPEAKPAPGSPSRVPPPARRRASLGKALLALRAQIDFLSEVFAGFEAISLDQTTKQADSRRRRRTAA